jgi:hypothetical protein
MTQLQYKEALAAVIAQGREKLDLARQLSKNHLESTAGSRWETTESGGGGNVGS